MGVGRGIILPTTMRKHFSILFWDQRFSKMNKFILHIFSNTHLKAVPKNRKASKTMTSLLLTWGTKNRKHSLCCLVEGRGPEDSRCLVYIHWL